MAVFFYAKIMDKFEKFVKITKIDKEERMVFGFASTDDLDSDGEVIKVSALEKALPSYMKFPTLREMHQPKAVGRTVSAQIKSGIKNGLYIGAKVVSDEAWKMVKEGVYPAFSIGGNVLKRVDKFIEELELVEISLVDVPANKSAVIELWKKDKADSDVVITTAQKIELLEKMDFESNEVANALRRGVIALMKNKELKKAEDQVEEDQTVKTDDEQETQTEEETTVETVETTEETTETTEEEKSADVELEKISASVAKLEKIAGVEEEVDTVEKMDLAKRVSGLVEAFGKLSDIMVGMNERLNKVESTPAEVKSKAELVLKTDAKQETTKSENSALEEIDAKLDDLNKKRDELGAARFSKLYSVEAGRLLAERDKLIGR